MQLINAARDHLAFLASGTLLVLSPSIQTQMRYTNAIRKLMRNEEPYSMRGRVTHKYARSAFEPRAARG